MSRQPANDKTSPNGARLSSLRPEVRQRLEDAVLEIFSESDFHQANIRDVAKKAGISFSTIYNHYGSKERLLFSVVDVWLGRLTDRITDHLYGIEDLKEKVRKVLWLQLDYYERHPRLGRILFMTVPMKTWMADETFQQRNMINLFLEALKDGQRRGILTPHVRAGVLLDVILGMVQRSFFMWVSRGQKESLSEQSGALFQIIWRAITVPGSEPAISD